MRQRSLNQALSASTGASNKRSTDNTLANVSLRVPVPGVPPDSLQEMESEGSSWYNALEMSLVKRLSHGFQFLASYTFSKVLDTDGADINSTSSGNALTLGRPKLSGPTMGTREFRPHSSIRFQHYLEPSRPISRRATSSPGRLVRGRNRNHPVRHGSYHRRHKCDECLWDQ